MKKIKKAIEPYFNCNIKGAISLFMAVLMTPFLTIAMVLVDTGRYNSAVSILDEAMGVSSTSTLAEMDAYLHKRWGILGVDQGHSVEDTYTKYLTTNAGILGESLRVDEITAEGMYSLAENEVLYNQILEYCKLNAPTELALNFGNISEILSLFDNLKILRSLSNVFTGVVETLTATSELYESSEELKTLADELDDQIQKYHDDYTSFENAVTALIEALNEPEPEQSDYKDEYGNIDTSAYEKAKREWEQTIEDARIAADAARDTYAETIDKLQENMTDYKKKMEECNKALTSVSSNLANTVVSIDKYNKTSAQTKDTLDKLQKEIKSEENSSTFDPNESGYLDKKDWEQALSQQVAEDNVSSNILQAEKNTLQTVMNGYNDSFSKYNEATFGECIEGLSALKTTVESFSAADYSKNSTGISAEVYHSITIASYVNADEVDAYLKEQENKLLGGSLKSLLEGVTTFIESICDTNLFFDADLSATIDLKYYNENLGGLAGADSADGSPLKIIKDIQNLIEDANNFKNNLAKLKFVKAVKNLIDIVKKVIQLFKDIIQFAVNIVKNITELVSAYDRLYYSTYSAFNLPCRTDVSATGLSFKGMTGYGLSKSSLPNQKDSSIPVISDLKAALNALDQYKNGSGDDFTFSGAELEYILFGSESEIANQIYTYLTLYLLRVILDIVPVMSNAEVQSLAAASTLAYPLVIFLIVLAEPLADTIVLVNGGSVKFAKTSIYLTPTGFPGLITQLVNVAQFDAEQKEKIKSSMVGAFGATDDEYDYQKTLNDYQTKNYDNLKSYETGTLDADKTLKDHIIEGAKDYAKGLQNFNYREYCFFMLLLTVTKEQQFARLKNLIQMETLYHYKAVEKKSYVFDLRKSYTYLDTKATVQVKQMMPSLIDTSLFTATRQQYRGY